MPPLTRYQQWLALKRYQEGVSANQIAKSFGCSQPTIAEVIKRAGIPKHERGFTRRKFPDKKTLLRIKRLYLGGHSTLALAERFNCDKSSIMSALERMGVKRRTPGRWPRQQVDHEQADRIVALWRKGYSRNRIAWEMGFRSSHLIHRTLIERGEKVESRLLNRERHPCWKGRVRGASGYWLVRPKEDDPLYSMAGVNGYVMEHRYVMASILGRPLEKYESVHHVNGDKTDNRPQNLQLRHGKHGVGIVLCCGVCGSSNIVATSIRDAG